MKNYYQTLLFSSLLTTMPIFFTPSPPDAAYLPSENYHLPIIPQNQYEWENYSLDIYSEQINSENNIINKIEIINKVALDLINNSVDLEPEIVNFVDEEFWNLI
ncbi:Uncharacterized protein dnl_12770 [Desulfonema limicola]|uniref:Uncharacterized protein n=1 Tax=Desulfonema limicola TaxID=45656 RepID=A0A975B587_9BACT|nr:hypothetical protein [Desulfonema limicola]QTA79030.1 Uncharacterized protein dnl_12770 [Desulfonema limicola]